MYIDRPPCRWIQGLSYPKRMSGISTSSTMNPSNICYSLCFRIRVEVGGAESSDATGYVRPERDCYYQIRRLRRLPLPAHYRMQCIRYTEVMIISCPGGPVDGTSDRVVYNEVAGWEIQMVRRPHFNSSNIGRSTRDK